MHPTLKHPSAWIPLALTAAILSVMCLFLFHIIPPEPTGDEGIGAHLFQIWVVLEFVSVLFFAIKWLPRTPRESAKILALQIALALVPFGIVFSQGW